MPQASIFTAVFSYNRPEHLANCLQTLGDMYPDVDVVVYDDNSSLEGVGETIRAFGVESVVGSGGSGRHGGLYANMQMAYERACAEGYDFLLCLQDDMQVVRPIDAGLIEAMSKVFEDHPTVASLEPRFARGPKQAGYVDPGPAPETAAPSAFRDYLDVSVLHVKRLAEKNWTFDITRHMVVSGEQTLSLKASDLGLRRIRFESPFAMHLPFPHLYRNRLRLPRLSGLRGRIYNFEYMSEAEIARMDARPAGELAHWRDYLTVADTNWFDRWLMSGKNDRNIIA